MLRLFTKTIAAIAFAAIAIFGVYDGFTDELDFATVMIVVISALGAVGFGLAAWADQSTKSGPPSS